MLVFLKLTLQETSQLHNIHDYHQSFQKFDESTISYYERSKSCNNLSFHENGFSTRLYLQPTF